MFNATHLKLCLTRSAVQSQYRIREEMSSISCTSVTVIRLSLNKIDGETPVNRKPVLLYAGSSGPVQPYPLRTIEIFPTLNAYALIPPLDQT